MINLQRDVPMSEALTALEGFTADLTDPKHTITFADGGVGRFLAVIVNREYPGGFGLVVDRNAVKALAEYFALLWRETEKP